MGLYIRGSVNRSAKIDNLKVDGKEGWEIYDALDEKLCDLAKKYNVHVDRENVDDYETAFVIHNHRPNSVHLFSGSHFENDLGIKDDCEFEQRSSDFIAAMRSDEAFSPFHNLEFGDVKKCYFTFS